MTSKPSHEEPAKADKAAKGRGVLDPSWELELERGRDADEEAPNAGSIEPELAMLHLLRHAREPESLSELELDGMWSDISAVVAPAKKSWFERVGAAFSGQWARWLLPVAGAAVVVLIFRGQGTMMAEPDATIAYNDAKEPSTDSAGGPTVQDAARARAGGEDKMAKAASAAEPAPDAEAEESAAPTTAQLLEQQFSMLEARGRAQVGTSVQTERTSLRSALIGQARGGAK